MIFGKKLIYRNYNGDFVVLILLEVVGYDLNVYDLYLMVVKFVKNILEIIFLFIDIGYGMVSNDFYICFIDYMLDGVFLEYYFYYVCEIIN